MMPAQEIVHQAFYTMLLYFLESVVNTKGNRIYKYMTQQSKLYLNCVATAHGKIQSSNSDSNLLSMVPYYVQFRHLSLLPSSVLHRTVAHFPSSQCTAEKQRCTHKEQM